MSAEGRAPAEGIEGGGGGGGGGLEYGTVKKSNGARARERESDTILRACIDCCPVCATSVARARGPRRMQNTLHQVWLVRAMERGERPGVQKLNKQRAGQRVEGQEKAGGRQAQCPTACPLPPHKAGRTHCHTPTKIETAEHGARSRGSALQQTRERKFREGAEESVSGREGTLLLT